MVTWFWLGGPEGIWLATTPSAAIHRASANRGYALTQDPPGIPNGWDGPLGIGFDHVVAASNRKKTIKNDVKLRLWPVGGRNRVPSWEFPIVSVHNYELLYIRKQKLSNHWPYLLRADLVLCRFRKGEVYPNFFETGHGIGWTCCRVTAYPKSCGWLKTEGRYRCPDCDWSQRFLKGSVTGER